MTNFSIKTFNGSIQNQSVQLINARELHEALKVSTRFQDWIKRRIADYSFTENAQVQYIEKIKREHGITQVNLNVPPLIIHYAAKHKPWDNHNPTLFERGKYWFFRHLDWSYLIATE